MKHELKIHPHYFCRVVDGSKTFEIGPDAGFQMGDLVVLKEYNPSTGVLESHRYTGKSLTFRVGFVLHLRDERVVFSLLPLEEKK